MYTFLLNVNKHYHIICMAMPHLVDLVQPSHPKQFCIYLCKSQQSLAMMHCNLEGSCFTVVDFKHDGKTDTHSIDGTHPIQYCMRFDRDMTNSSSLRQTPLSLITNLNSIRWIMSVPLRHCAWGSIWTTVASLLTLSIRPRSECDILLKINSSYAAI